MSNQHVGGKVTRPGTVSVVVVNYRGAQDTVTCVRSLADLDWPADKLEVVVVENASGDDSAEVIRRECPDVVLVEAPSNLGFAGGCNLGVAHASGDVVAFLNNDARPHPQWVSAAVETLSRQSGIGCVASKVLDWEGQTIDYVDGSMTWFGMGYKREVTRPDSPEYDVPRDVLFGTGAAMLMPARLFREVGGFDERFFMFYEDVDLGWRLNLLGHRVRYEPRSIAYHRHHATMNKFGSYRETYLLERNALLSMYKNYSDETLARVLPAAMALAVRRSLARTDTDTTALDLQRSPGQEDVPTLTLDKTALTGPYAIDYLVEQLPGLTEERRRLQKARRRSDRDLFPLFRQAMEPAYPVASYLEAHTHVVEAAGIEELFATRRRILVVTGEPLSERMAGPAIRAWEMARTLSTEHDVRLVSLAGAKVTAADYEVSYASGSDLRGHVAWSDVIIFQGFLLESFPWVKETRKSIVVDVYDPIHLEQLEQAKDKGPEGREHMVAETTRMLNEQLERGDFILCASEKQRDFWMGQMAALGRLNPATYDQDESLRSLIAVVPFGIPDTPPTRERGAIKGVVPGIGPDDKVILWGGGIYNWFDPLTLVQAVARLRERRPEVRLFFLGTRHPNPGVPDMKMGWDTRDLSDRLGLTDEVVFFNEGWVPYERRAEYLLDADLGVSTHLQHVETAFSFRTRILDYLWAGLPVVATEGDTFGSLIRERGLGVTVPAQDVEALEQALERMLYDEEAVAAARAAVADIATDFHWSRTLEPLTTFCRDPRRAADLVDALGQPVVRGRTFKAPRPTVRDDVALARRYLSEGGAREVVRRGLGRVRRILRQRLTGAAH
ncbi:glycosyltransferase [Thalassiella azotivora]